MSQHNDVNENDSHRAVDGSKRHESLHVVGEVSTVSIPVRVFSSLQDELLALEVMVLITHPAVKRRTSSHTV